MSTNQHNNRAQAPSDRPVWELDADERLLSPGPGDLGVRYDVVVVGGGVIGLTTAALCRRAGLGRVAVVERGRLAGGPSGRGAGILAPALHRHPASPDLVDFGHASLALWKRLDHEWAGTLELHPVDILETLPPAAGQPPPPAEAQPPGPAEARTPRPAAGQPPPPAEVQPPGRAPRPTPGGEVFDAAAARALEPRLAPGCGGVLVREQARVHPLRLAAALAHRAGSVATGVRVTGVEAAGPSGVRVRTDRGLLHAGAVVLATGAAPAIDGLPPAAGQLQVKGMLVTTDPAPFRLRCAVGGRDGIAGQLPDGRLLFGNSFDPTDRSPEVRPERLAATCADLEALVPDAAGLALSHAWTCFRPATAAGLPVIDKVAGLDNVWATYGHFRTGFLLAAATGQALAIWISKGERPATVAAFAARPAR